MRWTIEFGTGDPQDVTVATSGEATPEGFARMNDEFVEDARFRPELLVLVDHTELDVDELSAEDVRTIAREFAKHDAELSSAIVALVAPKPIQFGLARMSTILAEPATPTIRVFYARLDALAWLQQMRDGGS